MILMVAKIMTIATGTITITMTIYLNNWRMMLMKRYMFFTSHRCQAPLQPPISWMACLGHTVDGHDMQKPWQPCACKQSAPKWCKDWRRKSCVQRFNLKGILAQLPTTCQEVHHCSLTWHFLKQDHFFKGQKSTFRQPSFFRGYGYVNSWRSKALLRDYWGIMAAQNPIKKALSQGSELAFVDQGFQPSTNSTTCWGWVSSQVLWLPPDPMWHLFLLANN